MSKINWRIIASVISLVLIATLVASCAAPASPGPAPTRAPAAPATTRGPAATPSSKGAKSTAEQKPTSLIPVKVGHLSITSDAGYYIALEKGYFKEQGLDVQLDPFKNSVEMIPLLATGKLDVGGGAVNASLFNAINREIPIKVVADKGSAFPASGGLKARNGQILVVRKDLVDSGRFKSSSDFKGMTIAVPQTASAVYIELAKELEKGKLKDDDVKIVTMGFPEMVSALTNKAVDAAYMVEPIVTQVLQKGIATKWRLASDIYPFHTTGVVLYSPKFMSEQPEAAKKFMVAYLKGVRDFNEALLKDKNKAQIVQILVKNTNVKDQSLFDQMSPSGLNNDGYVNVEGMSADQEWYVAQGLIRQKQDMKDIVDNQFVDYALKVLGKASWGMMP